MASQQYLTVQALTKYIKRKFDFDPHLQNIYVKGEISNFKRHTSGHLYFTLKDDKARILAVMFNANARRMRFEPENGMNVLIQGEISVYEQGGQYQIYVKEMQPDGIGELYLAYEQLKEKLEKEGLFHPRYKKPLPKYPKSVGVITSPTGAAIRDIITTIKRRYPIANILIYPALVQGNQAAPSVSKAIQIANERKDVDVLIVGRGGGSIEELWAFNEEIVARAIFESEIPIISAVGHETDTTIADFVADLRAPTPTGAAEMAVPHIDELNERILSLRLRLTRATKEKINQEQIQFNRLTKSYAFRYPRKLYEQKLEQLDRTIERSIKVITRYIEQRQEQLQLAEKRLERNQPKAQFKLLETQLINQSKRLQRAYESILKDKQKDFISLVQTLDALSPLKIMERGYSLAYNEEDEIIKSVEQIKTGDHIKVSFSDGELKAKVMERKEY